MSWPSKSWKNRANQISQLQKILRASNVLMCIEGHQRRNLLHTIHQIHLAMEMLFLKAFYRIINPENPTLGKVDMEKAECVKMEKKKLLKTYERKWWRLQRETREPHSCLQ